MSRIEQRNFGIVDVEPIIDPMIREACHPFAAMSDSRIASWRSPRSSRKVLGIDADLHDVAGIASKPHHVRCATRRVADCLSVP